MAASSDSPLGIFYRSIASIFDRWTVLQLAVHHGYGGIHGREKALWMIDAVYNWFQGNEGIEPDELEEFIAEIMDNEFDTRAEDGSLISVAQMICRYFDLCKLGNHGVVLQRIQDAPKASLESCQALVSQDTEDTDDDEKAPCEHNLQAMMGHVELETSEEKPVINGLTEPSSSTDSPHGEPEDDGWTTVGKGRKK